MREAENLTERNGKLIDENRSPRLEVEKSMDGKSVSTELQREYEENERLQQWRAQSMHQILELERMNEALRSTLKLHSDCTLAGTQVSCDSHCGGHILLSKALAPLNSALPCPNQKLHAEHEKKLDLFRIAEKRCKSMEEELKSLKEQQASLQNMLRATQEELAAKDKEIQHFFKLNNSLWKTGTDGKNAGMTELASNLESGHLCPEKIVIGKVEDIEKEVQELRTTVKEQESTIQCLQKELGQKSEQLIFISDEKTVGEEALEASQNECNQLASLIKELDERMTQLTTALTTRTIERDSAVSAEKRMEFQAQKLCQINEENNRLVSEVSSLQRSLQSAEQKHHSAAAEILSLKEQLSMVEENRMAVEDRCTAKASELQAVAEDYRNAMCELQLLKNELLQMAGERENLFENIKNLNTRLQYFEQLVCMKDKEQKEFSSAYEKVSEEHQQLKLAAIELDGQVQQYKFQLQNIEEVLQRTQESAKSVDEESRKAKSELKNLGQQVDVMSHSLAQQSSVIEDLHKEKSALLTQLSMYKQEGETLATRFRMEHERVKELERLLACIRAQEHQLALESKDSGAKTAMMKDKLLSLEEEVHALHAAKDAQKEELLQLQATLRKKSEDENRRHLAVSSNKENQFHPIVTDSTVSKAKVHELELRTIALAADLSKTAALYKDCFARLQKAEAQCVEQKKEYEYVLSILSKVDDDRIQLQQKCRVLVGGTEIDQLKSLKHLDRIVEHPEVEVVEVFRKR